MFQTLTLHATPVVQGPSTAAEQWRSFICQIKAICSHDASPSSHNPVVLVEERRGCSGCHRLGQDFGFLDPRGGNSLAEKVKRQEIGALILSPTP